VIPASRGPEKLSDSQELKPSPSPEVALVEWLEWNCVYRFLCRRSETRWSFKPNVGRGGQKICNSNRKASP
jgi:hypothetical protein